MEEVCHSISLFFLTIFQILDFWAKAGVSVQQPQILFTNKFYVNTLFQDTANANSQVQFNYASLKGMRDNIQNSLSPPTVASTPIDHDNDGVVDQYNITMRIKKPL